MAQRRDHVAFLAGVFPQTKRVVVGGPIDRSMFDDFPHLSKMRVGFVDPSLVAEAWTAMLKVADIGFVGPINLPFTMNVEQPCELVIEPAAAPTNAVTVLIQVADLPDSPNLYGAVYLPDVPDDLKVQIPSWVVSVELLADPAGSVSGNFTDGSGTDYGTAYPGGIVARPREASLITLSTSGRVIFHY